MNTISAKIQNRYRFDLKHGLCNGFLKLFWMFYYF